MTGQEARDDEREALDYAIRVPISALGVEYRPLWRLIRAIQDSVWEAGYRKHPEPEITEARIEAAAVAMFEDTYGDGDWVHREEIEEKVYRNRARVALTAALRVPVGEGEQE